MEQKEIRFIDSHYNELFRIPDNSKINIKYADGHIEERICKYLDEYHTEINGNCFHICQWAELMEAQGNTYYPAEKAPFALEDIEQSEFSYMYKALDENEDRGCIGYLRADFDTGEAFFSTWFKENDTYKTPEFVKEFDDVINYFRNTSSTPLLKSRNDMYNVLYKLKPTELDFDNEVKGLKVQTDKHTYYLRCNPRKGEYNLYAYCYNTAVLEKYKNTQLVEKYADGVKRDKFFKNPNGYTEVYYNPDATAGGQLVYNEISHDVIKAASENTNNARQFFDYLSEYGTVSLIDIDTPEFRGNLESYLNRRANFEGCTTRTMNCLKKDAGIEIPKPHKSKNFER